MAWHPTATVAAVLLASVHLFAGRLRLTPIPRSIALSAGSGVSVAYVFVHLLPEVAAAGRGLDRTVLGVTVEHWEWLLALLGLVLFHALELRLRRTSRDDARQRTDLDGWLHLAANAAYAALIGYLLVEQAEVDDTSLPLFTIAMAVHLVVNDHGLRQEHGQLYDRRGRFLLAAAIVVGHGLSLVARVPVELVGLPLAFLAGSLVLIVLKEELPRDRRSRPLPFVLGAAVYAGLLLVV